MDEEVYQFWVNSVKKIRGWDFSSIGDRMSTEPLDWSYTSEILFPLSLVNSVLDIDTGGGEFLSDLPLPDYTTALESWQPNVDIAKNRLEPLGVDVIYHPDATEKLPFADDSFQLIICRHGRYNPSEVYRVLEDDGYFITQQVGYQDQQELNQLLLYETDDIQIWDEQTAVEELRDVGFEILRSKQTKAETRFYDIGALIFYLNAVSWQIPDFSPDRYERQLRTIHDIINQKGWISSFAHRFFISATK